MSVSTIKANRKDVHPEANWLIPPKYSLRIKGIRYKHEFFGRGILNLKLNWLVMVSTFRNYLKYPEQIAVLTGFSMLAKL